MCRYNWHSAGSLRWPFPVLKYIEYIFHRKYTEAVLSNSTRKLLWPEITEMLTAVQKNINLLCRLLQFSAHFRSLPLCLRTYLLTGWTRCRLRQIISKVRSDDISKPVLLSNLEYIAQVLETTYANETRYATAVVLKLVHTACLVRVASVNWIPATTQDCRRRKI